MIEVTHELEKNTVEFFNKRLNEEKGFENYSENDQLDSFTVVLPNGYQVDFNLINGNQEVGSWLDVILFDENGYEIVALPVEHYEIEGEYNFEVDDKEYIVNIVVK